MSSVVTPGFSTVTSTVNQQVLPDPVVTGDTVIDGNLTVSGEISFTDVDVDGNLTFIGTGRRITGDMSNATAANRLAYQSSTTNGATNLEVIPNGTSTSAYFSLENSSGLTNTSRLTFGITNSTASITSGVRGSGTQLPLILTIGATTALTIDTSANTTVNKDLTVVGLSELIGPISFGNGTTQFGTWTCLAGPDQGGNFAAMNQNGLETVNGIGGTDTEGGQFNVYNLEGPDRVGGIVGSTWYGGQNTDPSGIIFYGIDRHGNLQITSSNTDTGPASVTITALSDDAGDISIDIAAANDGTINLNSIPRLPSFSVSALPTGIPGGMIYVTDATPNPAMCFFNATSWIDVTTGVAVV